MTHLQPKTTFQPSALPLLEPSRHEFSRPASLVQAVDAAVAEIEELRVDAHGRDCPSLAFQPRVMMGVLTYCYARQIYSSAQILNLMRRDRVFGLMCENILPDAEWIAQFRRENRGAILQCLVVALLFQAKQKVVAGLITRVNEMKIAAEGKRRIIMAAFTDSLELDDCELAGEA